jgi:hypothetical protein
MPDEVKVPEQCATCRFWDNSENAKESCDEVSHDLGLCKRYPPTIHPQAGTRIGNTSFGVNYPVFPLLDDDDWCGEYQRPALIHQARERKSE